MTKSIRLPFVVALGWMFLVGAIHACGPDFPNNLLDRGDEAIMTAPEARFKDELARMKLVPSRFRAVPGSNAPLATLEAELADLRAALDGLRTPPSVRDRILEGHRAERGKVALFGSAPGASAAPASGEGVPAAGRSRERDADRGCRAARRAGFTGGVCGLFAGVHGLASGRFAGCPAGVARPVAAAGGRAPL